jgi:hypothetical protein
MHGQISQIVIIHLLKNERMLACRNQQSEQVLKQVCVVGRGCSSWVMSLMFSAEKMKMKWKDSWNKLRDSGAWYSSKNVLF